MPTRQGLRSAKNAKSRPLDLPAYQHLPRLIDRMNLKNRLGQVEADCDNLSHRWLLCLGSLRPPLSGASQRREQEPSTPSMARPLATPSAALPRCHGRDCRTPPQTCRGRLVVAGPGTKAGEAGGHRSGAPHGPTSPAPRRRARRQYGKGPPSAPGSSRRSAEPFTSRCLPSRPARLIWL